MSDRGDYRSVYVALKDDDDFHALSHSAQALFWLLKLELGAAGIGIVYESVMCERLRMNRHDLVEAYSELESAKPSGGAGWVQRESRVVWILNGLRYEPTLSASNKKHRTYIANLLAPLGERAIVAAFRAHYPEWFTDASSTRSDSHSIANRKGIGSLSKHSDSDIPSHPLDSDSDGESRAGQVKGGSAELPPAALAFARRFYADATPERKREVRAQLEGVLNGGATLSKGVVVTATPLQLARRCSEVVTEGVRNPDRAIVVLLRKLGDVTGPRGRDSPTERAAESHVATVRDEEREARELVLCYATERPAEYRAICARAAAKYAGDEPATVMLREAWILSRVRERSLARRSAKVTDDEVPE